MLSQTRRRNDISTNEALTSTMWTFLTLLMIALLIYAGYEAYTHNTAPVQEDNYVMLDSIIETN